MKQKVKCGVDSIKSADSILKGKRLGLITNPTGLDRNFKSTVDILNESYNLVCMFSPEHGVRGDLQAGDHVESYTDSLTGLPVYSLYGETPHISEEIMNTLDVIVFDIQDVGARFYTFLYTLSYAMEDAKKYDKEVLVLDRPNPIGGKAVEGTVLDLNFRSFVGRFPIATRYGLTIGEYASYINEKAKIFSKLHIVKCEGYNRELYYDDTDLAFVSPSPNIPTVDTAVCYIGTCVFEGTNVSEGRGTTKPFQLVGAPFIKPREVIKILNSYNLPGARFRETYFTPTFSKHQGSLCGGVEIHVDDRESFLSFKTGLCLLYAIKKTSPEFEFLPPVKENGKPFVDLLLGTDRVRAEDFEPDKFIEETKASLEAYKKEIEGYYLY